MDIRAHVINLNETRARVWEEAQGFLERIVAEKREMDAEETAQWGRYNARIDDLDAQVRSFVDREEREREGAVIREAFGRTFGDTPAPDAAGNGLVDWFRGAPGPKEISVDLSRAAEERRLIRQGADANELRSILGDGGASGGSLVVPTTTQRSIYEYLEASISALRLPTTKINTSSGETLTFPKVATHGVGTQVIAQGTAIGGTDPVAGTMSLGAYKYGQLVQVSNEMVTDSAFDIIGFVTRNVARAVGRVVNADLVVGTGSGEPNGYMTAPTVFANTGGSLINPTYETLIDLQHAIVDEYRGPDAAWAMRDATAAVLRKLRDGAGGTQGAPLWQPSITNGLTFGAPDRLLGFPVYTDPSIASIASNAKVICFADFSAYYVRTAGSFVFERSDDYAFNTDLVSFRGKTRMDGDLIDANAAAVMKVNV
jgi:HK97 family phage major capsid protein